MNSVSIIQAIATSVIALIAIITLCYGIEEYGKYKRTEKRPYISLFRIDIESNLTKKYPIWTHDKKKVMSPIHVIDKENGPVQEEVQEIIVDLNFKNTGSVAANKVKIDSYIFLGDKYDNNGKLNKNSAINESTNFKELYLNLEPKEHKVISFKALAPGQEMVDYFMFKPEEWAKNFNVMSEASRTPPDGTNEAYLVCNIEYDSINKDKCRYFGVYRLHHIRAWTKIYYALLMISEIE